MSKFHGIVATKMLLYLLVLLIIKIFHAHSANYAVQSCNPLFLEESCWNVVGYNDVQAKNERINIENCLVGNWSGIELAANKYINQSENEIDSNAYVTNTIECLLTDIRSILNIDNQSEYYPVLLSEIVNDLNLDEELAYYNGSQNKLNCVVCLISHIREVFHEHIKYAECRKHSDYDCDIQTLKNSFDYMNDEIIRIDEFLVGGPSSNNSEWLYYLLNGDYIQRLIYLDSLKQRGDFETINNELALGVRLPQLFLIGHSVIFVLGMVGNGLLLFTFARHRELLTSLNMIILNIAISDTLSLVYSLVVSLTLNVSTINKFDFYFSELAFLIFIPLCTGVNVYSVVMLSIQKFFVVAQIDKCRVLLGRYSSAIFIGLVWLIAIAISLVQYYKYKERRYECFVLVYDSHIYFCFFAYSVIPIILIAVFSLITSYKLRQSAHNMPGEAQGTIKVQKARIQSSKLIAYLTLLFTILYLPFYLSFVYSLNSGWEIVPRTGSFTELDGVRTTYYSCKLLDILLLIIFLNSCFNPVALYATNRSFREKINMLFTFRKT